jgi:predicted metal-binding membrane protein
MRRRLSLVLVAVLVVLAVLASTRHLWLRPRGADRIASTGPARDSLARLDSAAREDARQEADTMCFASRIGLPCDPR